MTKPLRAEEVLDILDRGDLSPETIICLLRDEIMRGHLDADETALEVDALKYWLAGEIQACVHSGNHNYRRAFNIVYEYIESKLNKETTSTRCLVGDNCPMCALSNTNERKETIAEEGKLCATGNCGDTQKQNLIDADALIKWLEEEIAQCNKVGNHNYRRAFGIAINYINSKLPEKEEELKPCPLCLGEGKYVEGSFGGHWVVCSREGCISASLRDTKEEAKTAWNTRVKG